MQGKIGRRPRHKLVRTVNRLFQKYQHHIPKGLELPVGSEKIVEFERPECGALVALLFSARDLRI